MTPQAIDSATLPANGSDLAPRGKKSRRITQYGSAILNKLFSGSKKSQSANGTVPSSEQSASLQSASLQQQDGVSRQPERQSQPDRMSTTSAATGPLRAGVSNIAVHAASTASRKGNSTSPQEMQVGEIDQDDVSGARGVGGAFKAAGGHRQPSVKRPTDPRVSTLMNPSVGRFDDSGMTPMPVQMQQIIPVFIPDLGSLPGSSPISNTVSASLPATARNVAVQQSSIPSFYPVPLSAKTDTKYPAMPKVRSDRGGPYSPENSPRPERLDSAVAITPEKSKASPVFDPVKGTIIAENLEKFVRNTIEVIRPALPGDATLKQLVWHRRLTNELESMLLPINMSVKATFLLSSANRDAQTLAKTLAQGGFLDLATQAADLANQLNPDLGPLSHSNCLDIIDAWNTNPAFILPTGASLTMRSHCLRLQQSLENIKRCSVVHLRYRDSFDNSATIAHVLAKKLASGGNEKGSERLQEGYQSLAALFYELKRHHLSAVASDVMTGYSSASLKHLERAAPGLDDTRAGANLLQSMEATAGIFAGIFNPVSKSGLSIVGSSTKSSRYLTDDDNDFNGVFLHGASASIGLEASVTGVKMGGKIKAAAQYGNFIEAPSLEKAIPLIVSSKTNERFTINSASPAVRKFRDMFRSLGRRVDPRKSNNLIGEPLFLSDKKLAKGAFNTSLIHQLGEAAFDAFTPNGAKSVDIKAAYPSVADQVEEDSLAAEQYFDHAIDRAKNGDVSDVPREMTKSKIKATVGISQPAVISQADSNNPDKNAYRLLKGSIEGEISVFADSPATSFHPGLKLSGSIVDYTMQDLNLERLKASHHFLAGEYNKDMSETLRLHKLLADPDRKGKDGEDAAPRMFYYNRTGTDLLKCDNPDGQINSLYKVSSLTNFTQDQKNYYLSLEDPTTDVQFADDIPNQFKQSICNPSLPKLVHLEKECGRIKSDQAILIDAAGKFVSVGNKFTSKADLQKVSDQRAEAFTVINTNLWGGKFPGGVKAAMKNPDAFIAQSYDALSLALGLVGTHISIIKREITREHSNARNSETQMSLAEKAVDAADKAFAITQSMMDQYYLPIAEDAMLRHSTIFSPSKVERRTLGLLNFTLRGPFFMDVLNAVPGFSKNEITPEVANSLGQMKMRIGFSAPKTLKHPNLIREGDYFEIQAEVEGGVPGLGNLINKSIEKLIEKSYPGTEAISHEEIQAAWSDYTRQAGSMAGMLDVSDGETLVCRWHRPNGKDDNDKLKWELQYVRVLAKSSTGFSVNLSKAQTAMSGAGMPVLPKAGLSINETTQAPKLEMMGKDISYHLLQYSTLVRGTNYNDMARGTYDHHHKMDWQAHFNKHPYLKSQYFGGADTITGVIDAYLASKAALNSGDDAGYQNGFDFFYRDQKIAKLSETGQQVERNAAGSTFHKGRIGTELWDSPLKPLTEIWHPRDLDEPNQARGEGRDILPTALADPVQWEQIKKDISRLKTVEERFAYLLAIKDQDGAIFDWYARICRAHSQISNDSKNIFGYRPQLRVPVAKAEKDRKSAEKAAKLLLSPRKKTAISPSSLTTTETQTVRTSTNRPSSMEAVVRKVESIKGA